MQPHDLRSDAVPYGDAALQRLRQVVDELQAGDRLARIAVVVPSNSVGVAARRWLARHGGIAAVDFVTAYRLAELLGSTQLVQAGRRPISTPVVDVAVRTLLAHTPGMLADVAQHPSTITAVRDAHRELREVSAERLAALRSGGSRRGREILHLHERLSTTLARQWYDETDLVEQAIARLRSGGRPPCHAVVVYLPQRLSPCGSRLLHAVAEAVPVRVVAGTTGATAGDEVISRALGGLAPPQPATPPPCRLTSVVDTSDADEEVRVAVRLVIDAAQRGVPFDRMAVVWPVESPYARLLEEHLDAAGIVWNGRSGRQAHEQLAPRALLDLLDLDRRGLRRAAVFSFLSHVPGRDRDGRAVPLQRWHRIARAAAIARDDWSARLELYRVRLRADAARFPDAHGDVDRIIADTYALEAFVGELAEMLGPRDRRRRWSSWAGWCHRQLERWLGSSRRIDELPTAEREALEAVQLVLDRLGRLDAIDGPVTRPEFREALAAELEATPRRVRRLGDGVHIGPVSFALGQPLDLLVVLGGCEGRLPAPPSADPLLSDADRRLTDGALLVAAERQELQHHQLLAAIAGAATTHLLWPRGDLRANAELHPTRWVTTDASGSTGSCLTAVEVHTVDSFASGLGAPFPTTPQQHRLRALSQAWRSTGRIDEHPLVASDPSLALGLRLIRARATPRLTEYDGYLPALATGVPGVATHAGDAPPISPSRLEQWAACPFGYFVRHVLHIQPLEDLDDQLRIDPAGRGTWLHTVLDAFHQDVLAGRLPQPGATGWTGDHLTALLDHFDAEAARLESGGAVGRPVFWQVERSRQRRVLERWLLADGAVAAERGATVISSEHAFGIDGAAPAHLQLADGRHLALRGKVDRIDRLRDGSLVVVDHKTGSAATYTKLGADDPTANATKVQLPAYAAAALAATGAAPGTRVRAEYSFTDRGDFRRVGYELTPPVWQLVGTQLQRVVSGIEAGVFAPFPVKPGWLPFNPCEFCDPDDLGTAAVWNEHVAKLADPRLLAALGVGTDEVARG